MAHAEAGPVIVANVDGTAVNANVAGVPAPHAFEEETLMFPFANDEGTVIVMALVLAPLAIVQPAGTTQL